MKSAQSAVKLSEFCIQHLFAVMSEHDGRDDRVSCSFGEVKKSERRVQNFRSSEHSIFSLSVSSFLRESFMFPVLEASVTSLMAGDLKRAGGKVDKCKGVKVTA